MAQEDSARTITTRTAGGSPYLEAYAGGDAIKYREGLLRTGIDVAQEERAQKSFDLSNLREARLQKQQDMELEYKARSEARQARMDELKFNEVEKKQGREHDLVELSSKIDDIDPMHKDAIGKLNELRHDSTFTRLLAHPETRDALNNILKSKTGEIQNVVGGIQQEAKSKYGIDADLSQFPTTKEGTWDLQKGYKEHLPAMAEQMRQRAEMAYATSPDKPGYTKYKEVDAYGMPATKFVKTEDLNKQKLEEMRLSRGVQMQAISAMQALRKEMDTTLGGFKQKALENPTNYLDEKGKPTKDPNNAAFAIWKEKGKEVARIPESERQDRLQKIESLSGQIQDWAGIAIPKRESERKDRTQDATTTPASFVAEPTSSRSTEPIAEPTQEPVVSTPAYSSDNPYAVASQKEQTEVLAKTAKEKQAKEKTKAISGRYKARQEEKIAEENLKDPSRLVQQYGEVASEPTTQELASAYEKAKTQLESAKAKRLWHEARDPEWAIINLGYLKGKELEDFKNNYLAPAIFEEAGGDPEKARAIANERGYSFE